MLMTDPTLIGLSSNRCDRRRRLTHTTVYWNRPFGISVVSTAGSGPWRRSTWLLGNALIERRSSGRL
jgi:hypothetical protein